MNEEIMEMGKLEEEDKFWIQRCIFMIIIMN
jgi:hypothetical protein